MIGMKGLVMEIVKVDFWILEGTIAMLERKIFIFLFNHFGNARAWESRKIEEIIGVTLEERFVVVLL